MKTLIIVGAGGHGRVVADCAEATKQYNSIVFIDDCYPQRIKNLHWDIIDTTNSFEKYIANADFIVAFGNNKLRAETLEKLSNAKANIITLIHPSACISDHANVGQGVVAFANSVVNIGAEIANGCIINTSATIDHDCVVGSCTHVSPGANVAGGVSIGEQAWIGIGASIIEYISIGSKTHIAAGAAVTQSTQDNALYAGVPATFKKIINS